MFFNVIRTEMDLKKATLNYGNNICISWVSHFKEIFLTNYTLNFTKILKSTNKNWSELHSRLEGLTGLIRVYNSFIS